MKKLISLFAILAMVFSMHASIQATLPTQHRQLR